MCARYTMATAPDQLIEEFEATIADLVTLEPHYNIAPTMEVPIVVQSKAGGREIQLARFGLIPHWAKEAKVGTRFINHRLETAHEKSLKRSFSRYRCLVLTDGFYEWRREGKQKVPHHFRRPDGKPFALAGLWSLWDDKAADEPRKVRSFTILTAPAQPPVDAIHDRMPLVLPKAAYGDWLSREVQDVPAIQAIVKQHRIADLERVQVSQRVNYVKNDDPTLVEAV